MISRRIPIANIYYMFLYAWNKFDEAQAIGLGGTTGPDLPNLLAKVLSSATKTLLRRGLDKGYLSISDDLPTVRGRIDLNGSVLLKAKHAPRLQCEFDELSIDVQHNRILKASLLRLSRTLGLTPTLAHDLRAIARQMRGVQDIQLTRSHFKRVQLHRNNAYYDLALHVGELAYDCLLPLPDGGGFRFVDPLTDDRKMAGVFESFVRNFYRAEQTEFRVEPLQIPWDAKIISAGTGDRLPLMRTDVFLRSTERQFIIDTKYYAEALQENRGVESFRSDNLYQIYAYLKHAEAADPTLASAQGVLLYPQVGRPLSAEYLMQGHVVRLVTLDLSADWPVIASSLKSLIS